MPDEGGPAMALLPGTDELELPAWVRVTMNRHQWLRAVKSADFPRELRPIRATLLTLADVMTADGTLSTARDKLIEQTGLPARTVDRHLARAVAGGWLAHTRRACLGRLSEYHATVPDLLNDSDCAPRVARNPELLPANSGAQFPAGCAPPSTSICGPRCAPPYGALNKESEQREVEAVDSNAQARLDLDSPPAAQEQLRAEEGDGLSTLEIFRVSGCQECQRLAGFGQPPCPHHRPAKPSIRVLQSRVVGATR
jgi:hypothetical protein